jgi:hypothetical protein
MMKAKMISLQCFDMTINYNYWKDWAHFKILNDGFYLFLHTNLICVIIFNWFVHLTQIYMENAMLLLLLAKNLVNKFITFTLCLEAESLSR